MSHPGPAEGVQGLGQPLYPFLLPQGGQALALQLQAQMARLVVVYRACTLDALGGQVLAQAALAGRVGDQFLPQLRRGLPQHPGQLAVLAAYRRPVLLQPGLKLPPVQQAAQLLVCHR